ncbi:ThuA domain-containing protein [uncultured Gimesia sp.]|uniref:ThuA domain-containing protein n=1 Tax=uncultured Gimesia sp. TaxID=1678688 RepID=UPI002627079A|nr:ThuA domain-containing protein [uncultured Gimesia sp.]
MKHKFQRLLAIFVCVVIASTSSMFAHDSKKKPDRGPKHTGSVLVFSGTGWYRHPETAAINGWLARLSNDLGMQVDVSETPADITNLLDRYDVLVLNNSNALTSLLDEKQRNKIEQWYKAGGGIVALHAALVRQTDWKWFNELAGCDFNSDSEFLEARIVVDPKAKNHPAVQGFGDSFQYKADWTNHDRSVTGLPGIQVLLRVDETTYEPVRDYFKERGGKAMGQDHPIAWTNTLNGGRFFYTELGHDVQSLETKFGRKHITQAIHWAARKDEHAKQNSTPKQ